MRTKLPGKIKNVLLFVYEKSEQNYGSWVFLPMYLSDDYAKYRLHPIRDFLHFRLAEKLGLLHMRYNESNAMLTLQGKKAIGAK